MQYLGGNVVVVDFGDVGVTFGLGGLVGRYGFLVRRVVLGGGVGAVQAGVITGTIILSVVVGVVFVLVGTWVTGATVVTTFISSVVVFTISFLVTGETVVTVLISSLVVFSISGGGRVLLGRRGVVLLGGSVLDGVYMVGVYGFRVQSRVFSNLR